MFKLKENELNRVSEILKLMTNKTRLSILCLLASGKKTVTEIIDSIDLSSQSAISQHLKLLRDIGWVACERDGRFIYYSLEDKDILSLMKYLKKHFCGEDYEK